MVDSNVEREYLVIYITALFGFITVVSAGIPLALGGIDNTSPVKIGIGYGIIIIGLIPLAFMLYKLLIVVFRPFINRRTAEYWYILNVASIFAINIIANLIARNVDVTEYAMVIIYIVFINFSFISLLAIDAVLSEKGEKTIRSTIINELKHFWEARRPQEKSLAKDAVNVYIIPLLLFYVSIVAFGGLIFQILGPIIGLLITITLALILSLESSLTRWRKIRGDEDKSDLIKALERDTIPIFTLPIICYWVSFILLFAAIFYSQRITLEINAITIFVAFISLAIPYWISVYATIYTWNRKNTLDKRKKIPGM